MSEGWALAQEIALTELADYVTEQGNPGNEKGVIEARAEYKSPLGNSIIYGDLVGQVLRALDVVEASLNAGAEPTKWERILRAVRSDDGEDRNDKLRTLLMPLRSCRACETAEESARYAVVNLVRWLATDEGERLYAESDGLCLAHLRSADSPAGLARLVASTRHRLQRLERDLAEFTRKQAWQYRNEALTAGERAAIVRAVRFMAGSDEQDADGAGSAPLPRAA